jgi:hypothetical protein
MAFFNMFRRTNMVNRRQTKVGGYGTRVASQRTTLNKLDMNRANLNRIAKEIGATRDSIAESQRQFAKLRKNYANKYVQYKKNARRVLGNNRTVMAKLGSGARSILATRQKNMNKKNNLLHSNSSKAIGSTAAGVAPRVPINTSDGETNAVRQALRGVPPPRTNSAMNNKNPNKK